MTYLQFHLLFNVPLLAVLLWLCRKHITRTHWKWIGVVVAIVVAFTYPWDNRAVGQGIWQFPEDRVLLRIGNLPTEEIMFFIIEAVAVCMAVILLMRKEERGERKE